MNKAALFDSGVDNFITQKYGRRQYTSHGVLDIITRGESQSHRRTLVYNLAFAKADAHELHKKQYSYSAWEFRKCSLPIHVKGLHIVGIYRYTSYKTCIHTLFLTTNRPINFAI